MYKREFSILANKKNSTRIYTKNRISYVDMVYKKDKIEKRGFYVSFQ